jgi:hypothetical protein
MKKLLILFLNIFLIACTQQNNKIADTAWSGLDGTKQNKTELYFFPNGQYEQKQIDEYGRVSIYRGNWEQTGNSIRLMNDSKFSEMNAKMEGDKIIGTAQNLNGVSWKFTYSKVNLSKQNEDSLKQKVFCFGVFAKFERLNLSVSDSNNEYFKRYKKEVFDVMNPILDKVKNCSGSNSNDFMIDQCAKKSLNDEQYNLFKSNISGGLMVMDAYQKKNETDLAALKFACALLQ